MTKCEQCGNDYDKSFQVIIDDETHVFDSFECAIEALAPRCETCQVRIIGHGVEVDGTFFCCARCAESSGQDGGEQVVDRIDASDVAEREAPTG